MMPLDCSLNQDIHVAVDQHLHASLPESDERKFSTSCPHRGTSAYIRLWHQRTAVAHERIVQDCYKMIFSDETIWDVRGIAVEGLGNRTESDSFKVERNKVDPDMRDPTKDKIAVIHKDAITAVAEMIESVENNWEEEEEQEEKQKNRKRSRKRTGRGAGRKIIVTRRKK
jgi:hypothetical protein